MYLPEDDMPELIKHPIWVKSKEIMKGSRLRNKFLNEVSLIEKHVTNKEIMLLVYSERKNSFTVILTLMFWQKIELSGKLLIPISKPLRYYVG